MKRYIALAVTAMLAVCIFTACAKKPEGTDSVTVQDGHSLAVVTKEGGGLDRNEDGQVVAVVTDDKGNAQTDADGKQQTEAVDLNTALVYDNRIEFNEYYIDIPKGWENSKSYNNVNLKKTGSADKITIQRNPDATFESKYADMKTFYGPIGEMYKDAEFDTRGIKISGEDTSVYSVYVAESKSGKPFYMAYIFLDRPDAVYSVMITAERDLDKDFGEIEKILNSVQFK